MPTSSIPAIAKTNEKSFADWLANGETALDDGDNESALTALTKAIEIDPQSATAINARGVAYLRMHKLSPALSDFNKAIDLGPNTAKFYGNRAFVYSDKEQYALAIADFTKAIQLEPQSPQWYRERGKIYVFMEDNRLAEKDFDAAKHVDDPTLERKQDLAKSQTLEAPPLGQGKSSNIDAFASEMRKLASDEFAFKDAQEKVFRARFDQRTLSYSPLIKLTVGRNTIVYPPKYDFGSKKVSLHLHYFYQHEARRESAGRQWPENTDSCTLTTEFELDQGTARQWKEAFDKGVFAIDLWFSPLSVKKALWQENHGVGMMAEGSLSHNIIFEAKTLRYEMVK